MAKNDKVRMIDEAVALNGVKIVLLIRVTPIPVHFSNLLLSATKVCVLFQPFYDTNRLRTNNILLVHLLGFFLNR